MIWKIAVFVWLGIEVWLSHENGEKSGEESAWLARRTGIKEGLLRRSAHFTLFAVLGLLTGFGFGWYGVGFAALLGRGGRGYEERSRRPPLFSRGYAFKFGWGCAGNAGVDLDEVSRV